MHELTDNALMLKVKSGDLNKMGLLYERHKKRMFGFFYNMNGDAMTSEDLVQNVFVRMLKYKHTYTGEGSFLAWMFRTARNVNNDHFKKNKQNYNQYDIASVEYKLEAEDTIGRVSDKKDNINYLKIALQKLSPEKREVLVLSKLKEMKFSEIGAVMGCSEGAAKVKAHRALKDLKLVFHQMQIR
ncbi:RNA polymerase sigma factor [Croceitalea rosinachiae]|uniref:RNA polymerase sigma factor n=1 Tax=Croceitalea rosinachiae TaxID=3075596 RepID=A0ABU3A7B6_9FLAO|nr:RNA polymerase sigma factor [Croceitalea sp. F388]MDT0605720.1 RNA polymerase sigma factor [Croceitalea sp. F388]